MGKAEKKRKGKKRRAPRGIGCGFCPAELDLFGRSWDEWQAEREAAGWSTVKVQTPGMRWPEGYNACPKCGDRLGPGPIDHVRRDARW